MAGALVGACHPVPSVAVTALATALAVATGRDARGCVLVAAAVLAGQLSIGWSNDVIDATRDQESQRVDKPLAAPDAPKGAIRLAIAVAVVACVPLSLASGLAAGSAHLVGVASGWAYNLGLKRTAWSWAPYAVAFALLAAFVARGAPDGRWPPWWLLSGAALLGVGAHFANVVPDIDADLVAGVRGLPQRLGRRRAAVGSAVTLLAATVVLVVSPDGSPRALAVAVGVLAGACAVLGASFSLRTARRWPFLLVIAVAGLDVGLLVAASARL